ncbi:MAG: hypothetical protein ACT4QD_15570 [Acidobacteriota bacterium]
MLTTLISPKTRSDLWRVPLDGSGKAESLLQTEQEEHGARISPNGRWHAYTSNEAGLGRYEVYVRPFPGPGGRHPVSTNGGRAVAWAASGREMFYREENRMMAVDVDAGARFAAGRPRALFTLSGGLSDAFDVAPDGQRFVMVQEVENPVTHINVVLNWHEGLARPGRQP